VRLALFGAVAAAAVLGALQGHRSGSTALGARALPLAPRSVRPVGVAATVNGRPISLDDFARALDAAEDERIQQGISTGALAALRLSSMVIDQLIDEELLGEVALTRGLEPAPDEVARALAQAQVSDSGAAPEAEVRRKLAAAKLRAQVEAAVTITESEAREAFLRRNDLANVSFVRFAPDDFRASVPPPTPEELQAWAAGHQAIIADDEQDGAGTSTPAVREQLALEGYFRQKETALAQAAARQQLARVKSGNALSGDGVKHTGLFTAAAESMPGIGNEPGLSAAIFAMKRPGPMEQIHLDDEGALLVLVVDERASADESDFAAVKDVELRRARAEKRAAVIRLLLAPNRKSAPVEINSAAIESVQRRPAAP
jgi:hypothetical protein